MKPLEAVLRPENENNRVIFARFEASRTWGSIITNTWLQLATEDVLEKHSSPEAPVQSHP